MHHQSRSRIEAVSFRLSSDIFAGALLGALLGAMCVLLVDAGGGGLIAAGAVLLAILGVVHGIGSGPER